MKAEIQKLFVVWDEVSAQTSKQVTLLPKEKLDEVLGSLFSSGPNSYFIIDFYDMGISYVSSSLEEMFGISSKDLTLNDILGRIHPDDMDFVAKAEALTIQLLYNKIGSDKLTKYKASYCFRAMGADGAYQLFHHQAIILSTDENGGFGKALNLVTNIQHLTTENNYKLSLIGLFGEPSYFNIDVLNEDVPEPVKTIFSNRELQLIGLIAEGYSNKEMASMLFIAFDTVKTHRKNIIRKAGVKSSSELIARCIHLGLI